MTKKRARQIEEDHQMTRDARCLEIARQWGRELLDLDDNAITEVVGEIAFEARSADGRRDDTSLDAYLPAAWEGFYQARHEAEEHRAADAEADAIFAAAFGRCDDA